jgi:CRP-like cAMP-binding protein
MRRLETTIPDRAVDAEPCEGCVLGRASGPAGCPFGRVRRPAGTLLVAQGERPGAVWYVREGTTLLSASSAGGEETLCALRGAGSLIGLEMLAGGESAHDAWTLSPARLCWLDAEGFREWIGPRDSPLGAVLELALGEAAERRRERIALAGRSVTRLARFLVERHAMEGVDTPLDVEHRVLARMLGMRPETLSRALARLRSAGALGPHGLVVADHKRLEEIAGEEAR